MGPPVGGALYSRIGFRAPFIFGEICTVVDLLGRLLIIERKDAIIWNLSPADVPSIYQSHENILPDDDDTVDETTENTPLLQPSRQSSADIKSIKSLGARINTRSSASLTLHGTSSENVDASRQRPSFAEVVFNLSKSPRALVGLIITFSYG